MNPIASTTSSPPPNAAVTRTTTTPVPEVNPVKATETVTLNNTATSNTNSSQIKTDGSTNKPKPSDEEVKRATENLQQLVNKLTPELKFTVDKASGEAIITLTDRNTNEVIRQIPSKEALELTRAMDQYQRGLILNRKA